MTPQVCQVQAVEALILHNNPSQQVNKIKEEEQVQVYVEV
jgi:hypothetical protein